MQTERDIEIATRMRWLQESVDDNDWDAAEGEAKTLLEVIQAEQARVEVLLEAALLKRGLTLLGKPVNEEQRHHLVDRGLEVGTWEECWKPAKTIGGGWAVLDTRDKSWMNPPMDTQESAQERADLWNLKIRVDAVEDCRRKLRVA